MKTLNHVMQWARHHASSTLMAVDSVALLVLMLLITHYFSFLSLPFMNSGGYILLTIVACLLLYSLFSLGFYATKPPLNLTKSLIYIILISFLVAAFLSVLSFVEFTSGVFLFKAWISMNIALSLVFINRCLFKSILFPISIMKRRILVLGTGRKAKELCNEIQKSDSKLLKSNIIEVVGYLQQRGERNFMPPGDIIYLDNDSNILDYAKLHNIDEVVVAVDDRRNGFPLKELLACRLSGIDVCELQLFYERYLGQVRLNIMEPSWLVFSQGFKPSERYQLQQLILNRLVVLLLTFVYSPLLISVLLYIKLFGAKGQSWLKTESFVGCKAEKIDVYAFNLDADSFLYQLLIRWGALNFPRLFNVWSGTLNLVGPKLLRIDEKISAEYVHDYFSERYTVKPGLVSWSETCVYNESLTPEEMLYYDLFYVKNKSIDLDVRILKRFVHYFNGLHKGHNKLMWIFKRKPS